MTVLAKAIAEAEAAPNRQARFAALAALISDPGALIEASQLPAHELAAALLRLEGLPGMTPVARQIRKIIDQIRPAVRLADDDEPRPLLQLDHLPAVHVPDRYVVRDGIHERKTTLDGITTVQLTHRVILPTLVLADIDTGERSVQLEWQERRGWGSRIVAGSMVQDPRAFVRLRDAGAPVAAHNARDLARFIDAVEEHNTEQIPRAWATRRMGWMGEGGKHGYMWGATLLERPGPSHTVLFDAPPDDGASQVVEGYRAAGTRLGWLGMWEDIRSHPSVLLGVYASLAAPFLGIVPDAPNAIVDWSGETSRGKTTAMRCAASIWGLPDERAGGIIHSWRHTATSVERVAEQCHHTPLFLDDTKLASKAEYVTDTIYGVANGRGKGRGTVTGRQRTATWRTVMISTGESPATSFTQDGGSRARVLPLQGQPFGAGDSSALVARVRLVLQDHYGHIGPEVVRWLDRERDRWDWIREMYRERVGHWTEQAGDSPVGSRMAQSVALLELGAWAAHEIAGLPRATCDPFALAWTAMIEGIDDTDRPAAALRDVYSWAVEHGADMWGRHVADRGVEGGPGTPRVPTRGWAGSWHRGELWDVMAFTAPVLRRLLRREGYEPAGILASWKERGWIKCDQNRQTTKYVVGQDGERPRCVVILRAAFAAVEDDCPDVSPQRKPA